MSALALLGGCDKPDRVCGWDMLPSDPVRDRAGLGGGVPMFARALREFILWPKPCASRVRRTKDVCVRCTRGPECGVAGTFVCWEAGAYGVVGRNAASNANRRSTEWRRFTAEAGSVTSRVERPQGPAAGRDVLNVGSCGVGSDAAGSDVRTQASVVPGELNFWTVTVIIGTHQLQIYRTARRTGLGSSKRRSKDLKLLTSHIEQPRPSRATQIPRNQRERLPLYPTHHIAAVYCNLQNYSSFWSPL